jgi:hypothetical protein
MKRFLLALLFISPLHAMELVNPIAVSSKDEALKLYTNHKDMYVEDQNATYRIQASEINNDLRELLKHKALTKFIEKKAGHIRISQLDDGTYALRAKVHGDGGFLLTGVIIHQACRVVGYSGLVLGSGSAIVAGFAAGGPVGAVTAASGVIAASPAAAAQIEAGSLAIGTAASWIPWLP